MKCPPFELPVKRQLGPDGSLGIADARGNVFLKGWNPRDIEYALTALNSHEKLVEAGKKWQRAFEGGSIATKDLGTEILIGEAIEQTKAALAAGEKE